jgi:hypothetical protein
MNKLLIDREDHIAFHEKNHYFFVEVFQKIGRRVGDKTRPLRSNNSKLTSKLFWLSLMYLIISGLLIFSIKSSAQEIHPNLIDADGSTISWDPNGLMNNWAVPYMTYELVGSTESTGPDWKNVHIDEGSSHFWPNNGAGNYQVRVCNWSSTNQAPSDCTDFVTVTFAIDSRGTFRPIPRDEPRNEIGSIQLFANGNILTWEVEGTVGQHSGFLLSDESDFFWQPRDARSATYVPEGGLQVGQHELTICGFDHYRIETGICSNSVTMGIVDSEDGLVVVTPPQSPIATGEPAAPVEGNPTTESIDISGMSYSEVLAIGNAAWRAPDENGEACINCHVVDGIDLAYPNFTRADILRRGERHVGVERATQIADMIDGIRQYFNWTPTINPREWRPFQPGPNGQPLPGDTPMQRDDAFADLLAQRDILLMNGDIDSIATARQAMQQLVNLDLFALPLAIEFSRFSEDPLFGEDHEAFNEWPLASGAVPNPSSTVHFYDHVDAYLQNPDENALYALIQQIRGPNSAIVINQSNPQGRLVEFEGRRYESLQLLGDHLRTQMAGAPPLDQRDNKKYASTAFFNAGQDAAYDLIDCNPIHNGDIADCPTFPNQIDATSPRYFQQLDDFAFAWRGMGTLFDPGLTGERDERDLLDGHYHKKQAKYAHMPFTHVFISAIRVAHKFFGEDNAWRTRLRYTSGEPSTTNAHANAIYVDHLISQARTGGHDLYFVPENASYHDTYYRFTANFYKMLLFLVEDEVTRTGEVYDAPNIVRMILGTHNGDANLNWWEPHDFLPMLTRNQPEQAQQFREWMLRLANMVEQATDRDPTPGQGIR